MCINVLSLGGEANLATKLLGTGLEAYSQVCIRLLHQRDEHCLDP